MTSDELFHSIDDDDDANGDVTEGESFVVDGVVSLHPVVPCFKNKSIFKTAITTKISFKSILSSLSFVLDLLHHQHTKGISTTLDVTCGDQHSTTVYRCWW
jgi:hypothetical protein